MIDLFGNEGRPPQAALRPVAAPVALDLFSAAAEKAALQSSRPLSQERAEILAPAGTCPVHQTPKLLEAGGGGRYSCPRCA